MKIIFFGTPSFVVQVLKSLVQTFEVIGVVTAPDAMQGRKKLLTPSPVKAFAVEQNIPVYHLEKLEIGNWKLEIPQADLYVVAAYGKIIPLSILKLPKNGALNIHPSLLPKHRGPSPIQTAILHGDKITGVSVIKMDEKMDHGPIISQWETAISAHDTFESLHNSLFQEAAERLPAIITDFIDGKIKPNEQDETNVTFCKMITRESGYFDSTNPPSPEELDRMIRAYYPWPTAWTRLHQDYGGQALKGKIMKLLPERKIQMEGKNVMEMKEFLNGYPELTLLLEKLLGMQY